MLLAPGNAQEGEASAQRQRRRKGLLSSGLACRPFGGCFVLVLFVVVGWLLVGFFVQSEGKIDKHHCKQSSVSGKGGERKKGSNRSLSSSSIIHPPAATDRPFCLLTSPFVSAQQPLILHRGWPCLCQRQPEALRVALQRLRVTCLLFPISLRVDGQ